MNSVFSDRIAGRRQLDQVHAGGSQLVSGSGIADGNLGVCILGGDSRLWSLDTLGVGYSPAYPAAARPLSVTLLCVLSPGPPVCLSALPLALSRSITRP